MKSFARISMAVCLTLLVACSTKPAKEPAAPQAIVLDPPPSLLQMCVAPILVPSKTNADIINNSLGRQLAFDQCDARHACLIRWYDEAKKIARDKGVMSVPKIPDGCGN